jgi:hypothetical protein
MNPVRIALLCLGAAALAACSTVGKTAEQQLALEQQACAETGLTPGTGAFSSCLLDMKATVAYGNWPVSNP